MLEAEVAFTRTLDELLDVVEDGIRAVLKRLMWEQGVRAERNRSDLELIAQHQSEGDGEGHLVEARGSSGSDTDTVDNGDSGSTGSGTDFEIRGERPPLVHILNAANKPFKRISYTDAITLLSSAHEEEQSFVHTPTWGEGLSTEHEKWLASHFAGPVFVTHYPRKLKPFYMLPSDADPSYDQPTPPAPPTSKETETVTETETVACFDLLFPGIGEMAGGSLREYRVDQLESAMETAGLDKEAYEWYLDLRRFGSVPHGGWGMGWDRWVCWVTGVGNVRDVVPFPRWKGHCKY
jgi:asparaginyl-tRNA synthetase